MKACANSHWKIDSARSGKKTDYLKGVRRPYSQKRKTIPGIYDRESMATDLLLAISRALRKDFFDVYYTEEPLKSLRNDQVVQLNIQIENLSVQMQKLTEEVKLQTELNLTRDLNQAQKEIISFAKAQIEDYKQKLAGISHC